MPLLQRRPRPSARRPGPVRTVLTLIDGVVAGEGEGPLAPRDVPLGAIVASTDPVAADLVAVRLMGFDERKLPKLCEPMRDAGPRITRCATPPTCRSARSQPAASRCATSASTTCTRRGPSPPTPAGPATSKGARREADADPRGVPRLIGGEGSMTASTLPCRFLRRTLRAAWLAGIAPEPVSRGPSSRPGELEKASPAPRTAPRDPARPLDRLVMHARDQVPFYHDLPPAPTTATRRKRSAARFPESALSTKPPIETVTANSWRATPRLLVSSK